MRNTPRPGQTAAAVRRPKQGRQILVHVMASKGQQVLARRAPHRRTLDRDAVGNYLDPIRLHTERHQLVVHIG